MEKKDWGWLPKHMPGVAVVIAEKRALHGAAWVNECWHKGVVEAQPGWFFAAQGSMAVGVPPAGMAEAFFGEVQTKYAGSCLVFIKEPAHASQ